jgi:glycosyltransferase involved in cell wall biosynthesis
LPAEAAVVGFVGRLTRDKGIGDLVNVFASTLRRRPDVWLLLVGQFEEGDPVPDAVRAAIERDERIVTVPWLDHTGVAYRAMDVLAFPSYREGLPNVPLEAQLSGLPIVGYAATGTVDAVAEIEIEPAGAGTNARRGELNVLVAVGDVDPLGRELVARLSGEFGRSPSSDRASAWVAQHFDQALVWSALVDRYRAWIEAP